MKEMVTIKNMYSLEETLAKPLLEKYTYPWEVLPHIGDFILELIDELPKDVYEEHGVVHQNFTQVYQDLTNIVNSVQNSGGSNLIKNSVMFAYDYEGKPEQWETSQEGEITIQSNAESLTAGGLSGHTFTLLGKKVSQTIQVKASDESDADKT